MQTARQQTYPMLPVSQFSGPVVSVLDGDTIEVLHNHHPERIRLSGIKTALRHLTGLLLV